MEKKLCAGIGIGKFFKCDGLLLLAEQADDNEISISSSF